MYGRPYAASLAWVPKATVQAVLCALPYDRAVAAYGAAGPHT